VVRFFAEEPASGRVALRIADTDWVYPYFGSGVDREVFFVSVAGDLDGFDWLVVSEGRAPPTLGPGWSLALRTEDGWRVYRRAADE
jgi:hypothetical protein